MMKRKLCVIVMFSFLLTGCQSTQLTKTESGQISEYIAYSLLKFNDNPDLVNTQAEEPIEDAAASEEPVEVSKEPAVEESASNTPDTVKTETQATAEGKETSAGALFGSNDLKISVKNSGLYDNYPKNSSSTYFSLTASSNKKLFVLELTVKNEGSKTVTFKTSNSGLEYTLDGSSEKALVTLLEKDIHFFKTDLKSGKSLKGLVIFEVDKNFHADNLNLVISKDGDSVIIPVK